VFTDGLAHLSYLIGDKAAGVAAVIDPRRDVDVYVDLARSRGLTITHVLETHIHADFVSGTCELVDATGTATAHVSVAGGARYGFAHKGLRDGSRIELGSVVLTARHTPGHTPEHLAFFAANAEHPEKPFAVFSGDCLFADSVGRPDLLGADQAKKLAKALFRSLHDVFLQADDDVLVYPAHGAGSPCGADIGDRLVTSIGYERKNNPALQIRDEAEFVEFVLHSSPPEPRYYQRMKKLNARGPDLLGGMPACPPLQPEEFEKARHGRAVRLVDNRDMLAFGGGHIPGAINIGPKPMLSIWAGWFFDDEHELLLVLPEPSRLKEVLSQFARVGCTRFRGYLAPGMEGWLEAGMEVEKLDQWTSIP
jgi:hydroxyacylglutathione hydrolase